MTLEELQKKHILLQEQFNLLEEENKTLKDLKGKYEEDKKQLEESLQRSRELNLEYLLKTPQKQTENTTTQDTKGQEDDVDIEQENKIKGLTDDEFISLF